MYIYIYILYIIYIYIYIYTYIYIGDWGNSSRDWAYGRGEAGRGHVRLTMK